MRRTLTRLSVVVFAIAFPGCELADVQKEDGQPSSIVMEELSVVRDDAAIGDYSNDWGGHQPRIVRTSTGDVFTASVTLVDGEAEVQVVQRGGGGWTVVHRAPSGPEPPHLLRGPDDRLYLIVSQEGDGVVGHMDLWSTGPGDLQFVRERVPGEWHPGEPLYSGAGMSPNGILYVAASFGGHDPGGAIEWNVRETETGSWGGFSRLLTDYRYAYAYVLPRGNHELYLVAGRDVLWEVLGYERPDEDNRYAFDAVRAWHASDARSQVFSDVMIYEEKPTAEYPAPSAFSNYQGDAYVDSRGRLHVVYVVEGASTGGFRHVRHAVVEGNSLIHDALLPNGQSGAAGAVIQDSEERLYLIEYVMDDEDSPSIAVYPALDEIGTAWDQPTILSLEGNPVRYSGMTLATSRGGMELADVVDGGFPSGDFGEKWVYFRVRLR